MRNRKNKQTGSNSHIATIGEESFATFFYKTDFTFHCWRYCNTFQCLSTAVRICDLLSLGVGSPHFSEPNVGGA